MYTAISMRAILRIHRTVWEPWAQECSKQDSQLSAPCAASSYRHSAAHGTEPRLERANPHTDLWKPHSHVQGRAANVYATCPHTPPLPPCFRSPARCRPPHVPPRLLQWLAHPRRARHQEAALMPLRLYRRPWTPARRPGLMRRGRRRLCGTRAADGTAAVLWRDTHSCAV